MYLVKFIGRASFTWNDQFQVNDSNYPQVTKVGIISKNNELHFSLHLVNITKEHLTSKASEYLQRLLDALLYNEGRYVDGLEFREALAAEADGNYKPIIFSSSDDLEAEVKVVNEVKAEEARNKFMNLLSRPQSFYREMYIDITRLEIETARYILYYSLLFEIVNENKPENEKGQKNVDDFIKQKLTQVVELPATKQNKANNKMETIFTYLRNQIGHTQKSSVIRNVKSDIKNHILDLQSVVKSAIEQYENQLTASEV